jgi:hypothetical protein
MDVPIPKMMFKNKLLKLPSKIPSLNLPFISTWVLLQIVAGRNVNVAKRNCY